MKKSATYLICVSIEINHVYTTILAEAIVAKVDDQKHDLTSQGTSVRERQLAALKEGFGVTTKILLNPRP